MRMIGRIFADDVRRLTSNVAAIIIVLGITVIPALFAWFNVAACWNPFGNTRDLQFAIANDDEGYQGSLLPMKVNIGDQVVSSLRANSQLDWNFTSSEEAVDGTRSGKYYAAVVIPKDFSRTMMTFFTSDADHATLDYYDNEKLNALAPKVTDQGADTMSAQINETFAKTLTDAALGIAQTLVDRLDQPEAQDRIKDFNGNIKELAGTLTQSATLLTSYGSLTASAQTLLESSATLVSQADDSAKDASGTLSDATGTVSDLTGAVDASLAAVGDALSTSADSLATLGTRIDTLMADVDGQVDTAASGLAQLATTVDSQADAYGTLASQLQSILDSSQLPADSSARTVLQGAIDRLTATRGTLAALSSQLSDTAGKVRAKVDTSSQDRQQAKDLAAQAKASITGLSNDFDTTIKPGLVQVSDSFTSAGTQLGDAAATLKNALGSLDDTASNAKGQLDSVRDMLDGSAADLQAAADRLTEFSTKLGDALTSGDMDTVRKILGTGSGTLAAILAAPVQLDRTAVFPVESFGAALAPFYTFIPLFVGATLMVVGLKVTMDKQRRHELGDPKPWQSYLGHYCVFGLISLIQSTFSLGGTLLFIRVHAVHPFLFLLTGWLAGLVFSLFTYTMVAAFGNVGKALCVLVLVMQMTGSDGAYPLVVLPHYVNAVSPFLPATYAIRAMRAAMCGIYGNQYWTAMGQLALFVVPLLFAGLVLRAPLLKFNDWVAEKAETSKLVG